MFLLTFGFLPVAKAQSSEGCALPVGGPALTWSASGDTQLLLFVGNPGDTVSVTFRALLAELETTWVQGPYVAAGGELVLHVEPPASAFLHAAAADYVTDLVVTAQIGRVKARAPQAYLAWPSGKSGAAVVWTADQQRTLAPHGVIAASAAAVGLTAADPEERWMPDVTGATVTPESRVLHDTGSP